MPRDPLIHVGYLIDRIGSSPGGTEKQLLTLIRHLSPDRFRPSLYVLKDSDFVSDWAYPCRLQVMHVRSLRSPGTLSKLATLRRLWVADGLHILQTQFLESNLLGIPLARSAGIPRVITTRRNQTPQAKRRVWPQRAVNRFADLMIVNSGSTKRWVMKVEGVPEAKIRVVYNAVDVDRYAKLDVAARHRLRAGLGIEDDAPVVGICANLRPVKSIDVFLRAAAVVAASLPRTRFLVIGEDEDGEEARLKRLCRELGLEERVCFLGARQDVPDLLSILQVGVLSSSSESMSNSVTEYMATGLPVVATEVGGISELIEEGINGFRVPVGDSESMGRRILEVLRDWTSFPEDRNSDRIRQMCGQTQVVGQYESIYRELVAGSD